MAHEYFSSINTQMQTILDPTSDLFHDLHDQVAASAAWPVTNRLSFDEPFGSLGGGGRGLLPKTEENFQLHLYPHHHHHQQQQQQQQFLLQGGRLFPPPPATAQPSLDSRFADYGQPRRSKYLAPAQELLNEFCNLGMEGGAMKKKKQQQQQVGQWEEAAGPSSSSSSSSTSTLISKSSLQSLDILELHRRKVNLLSMLEELEKRYRMYREQMRAVAAGFEAVAGGGAAGIYCTPASEAVSRHFRCLRDAVVGQLRAITKKVTATEKDRPAGATRGETPRLKLLDQCIRKQRAFQQGGVGLLDSSYHPWRPQRGLPERAVSVLRAWLFEHFLHPYPSDVDKHILARQTGLSRSQVSNWFINARVRLWKPMVEDMYMEETKEQENNQTSSDAAAGQKEDQNPNPNPNLNPSNPHLHEEEEMLDQKPEAPLPELNNAESFDSLSSIVNNSHHRNSEQRGHHHHQQYNFAGGRGGVENFGAAELDFSSYSNGGVSLTLGLQQHHGGGMSLSFSPAAVASQNSLFFSRELVEVPMDQSCLLQQFSGNTAQNIPYRNLMGAAQQQKRQLLHDLAG